ncbi:hypothetical protein MKX03_011461, partial [Papaver bracteatum]
WTTLAPVFVALDSEVQKMDNKKSAVTSGFSQILQQAVDFQITINFFNMKQKIPTSFTVTRINSPALPGKGIFATFILKETSA